MSERDRRRTGAGLALAGGFTVGFLGILFAAWSTLGGDRVGAGLFLIASAIAFGLLANACLRG